MSSKIYIGGLSEEMQKEDIEEGFGRFGEIEHVWVARKPAGFAFVTYKAADSTADAIREMNGVLFKGQTLKVELSNAKRREREPRRDPYASGHSRRDDYERPRHEEEYKRRDREPEYHRRDHDDHYRREREEPAARYDDRDYRRDDYYRRDDAPQGRYEDYRARSPVPPHPAHYSRRSRSIDRRRY